MADDDSDLGGWAVLVIIIALMTCCHTLQEIRDRLPPPPAEKKANG